VRLDTSVSNFALLLASALSICGVSNENLISSWDEATASR